MGTAHSPRPLLHWATWKPALAAAWILAGLLVMAACGNTAAPTATASRPTSIFNPQTTVLPAEIPAAPTMSIAHLNPTQTATVSVSGPADPDKPPTLDPSLAGLTLPFDPDEIAAILKANPAVHFRYKHRAFVFPNCSTLTHLGEIMELYANFTEGSSSAPAAPSFKVYAPTDLRILKVWGTQRYRLVLNTRIGENELQQPQYLSLLSVTRLDERLAQKLSAAAGISTDRFGLAPSDPLSQVGPYLFTPEYQGDADDVRAPASNILTAQSSVLVHQGELIGYKEGPWEWYPTCEAEHTLSLHVFPTTNNAADHTQAVETYVPAFTHAYLDLVVRELVIKRGLTIDVQYRSRNIGHEHEFLAEELFSPEVRAQISLSPWLSDIHPQRFTVSPSSIPPVVIGPDE